MFYFDVSCGVKVADILQCFFSQCLLSTSDKACMKPNENIVLFMHMFTESCHEISIKS